jgi:hypothetical protein
MLYLAATFPYNWLQVIITERQNTLATHTKPAQLGDPKTHKVQKNLHNSISLDIFASAVLGWKPEKAWYL